MGNTDLSVGNTETMPYFSVGDSEKPNFRCPEKDSKVTNRDPCFIQLLLVMSSERERSATKPRAQYFNKSNIKALHIMCSLYSNKYIHLGSGIYLFKLNQCTENWCRDNKTSLYLMTSDNLKLPSQRAL